MSEFLFWISITALFYVYFGYYLTLKLLYAFIQPTNTLIKKTAAPVFPQVSVVIAAFNEEKNIAARIKNLLEQDYPGQMEIIVASDGSNDNTVSISSQFKKFGVKVLDFKENRGRAKVHNDAIEDAAGDIVVTTDAETIFEKNFITQITAPFQDSRVGCTVGRLYFWDKKSGIAKAEGLYWKWEVRTRILQDKLGVLMTGTGACTAFRKILFKKLRPVDDIDFATTIDVILAGLKVKYVQDAVAWDDAPGTLKTELNGRIRSSKRLVGTLSRWGTFNWFYHPLYSWTLFSHKLLRWSSPFFILTCFFANLFLLGHPLYNLSLFLMGVAVIFTIAGSLEHFAFKVKRIPFASVFFSFFMANLGFFIGFIKIVTGRIPIKYKVIEE